MVLVPFDRLHMIFYQSSTVRMSHLFVEVAQIL